MVCAHMVKGLWIQWPATNLLILFLFVTLETLFFCSSSLDSSFTLETNAFSLLHSRLKQTSTTVYKVTHMFSAILFDEILWCFYFSRSPKRVNDWEIDGNKEERKKKVRIYQREQVVRLCVEGAGLIGVEVRFHCCWLKLMRIKCLHFEPFFFNSLPFSMVFFCVSVMLSLYATHTFWSYFSQFLDHL